MKWLRRQLISLGFQQAPMWDFKHEYGRSYCGICGKGYNSHGINRNLARRLHVSSGMQHLVCRELVV